MEKSERKINPVAAVVGVGVAVVAGATAAALSKKENRTKVKNIVEKGKAKASELKDNVTSKVSSSKKKSVTTKTPGKTTRKAVKAAKKP